VIYLITGVPGSGKTSLLVSLLVAMRNDAANPRLIFQHAVRGLKLPATKIYCRDVGCEFCGLVEYEQTPEGVKRAVDTIKEANHTRLYIDEFRSWCPPNGVIVLDEVQQQYRVRGRAAPVPKFVQDLEVNRHSGVDLYLLTQNPRLIDSNIRDLVNVHHHLEPHLLGTRKRTFMGCQSSPERATTGESSPYKPDPKTFDLYHSAELHTKIKKPIPKAVFVLGFALLLGVVGSYFAVGRVKESLGLTDPAPAVAAVDVSVGPGDLPDIVSEPFEVSEAEPVNRDVFDFEPNNPGVLESAPAYQGMVSYKDFPRRAACLKSGSRCRCYTQQGTDYPTSAQQCESFIEGRVSSFNPYAAPRPMYQASQSRAAEGSLL